MTAWRGGEPIGFVYWAPAAMTDRTWHLYWIAVRRDLQALGSGARLLAFCEAEVRAAGGRLLLIETTSLPGYAPTRRFYKKHGYEGPSVIPTSTRTATICSCSASGSASVACLREIARGLAFPEGPVCLPDGSVLVVEIRRGTLTRVAPDGAQTVVAEPGGGPNGAAIGPDGEVYVCNNGGFEWHEVGALAVPGNQPASYTRREHPARRARDRPRSRRCTPPATAGR